ncbi:TRAP transporter substrate-binding protein [Photobacterium swingsii]|uniref:ABC transporter substrate-binding protein n=1 Tax=Photobacterium swingsii TaxID=680026 RepID=A0A0J8Y112_9GAMM|nr:TRAP transporter substrate-binding protein [Photobacterium swingsii]KMV31304.1 ABC transporter substrate-binding protein [Photobacterium swingsii]PSW24050.1 ABC transporter substrate-binding protein [Photobacterium swingsii]
MIKRFFCLVLITTTVFILSACNREVSSDSTVEEPLVEWKLVTSWPKGFPGLGFAPEYFAEQVARLSAGKMVVKVYGAGELVPSFEVFNAVSKGTAQMGHSAAYYWEDKIPAAPFFAAVPFGMTAQEMNAWLHYGGGLALWQELYAPYGVIPMAGGNTGTQMGGWFNTAVKDVSDLKGLKMRLPGYGAEVLKRAGGIPVSLPGGELFTALETGAIDATEWVGPFNDLAFGLHNAARYYYYPAWHEPSTNMEFLINKDAFQALPDELKAIVETAARATSQNMLDEYTVKNVNALSVLLNEHDVKLKAFPEPVLMHLKTINNQLLQELSQQDPSIKKIYASYHGFLIAVREYGRVTDNADVNID